LIGIAISSSSVCMAAAAKPENRLPQPRYRRSNQDTYDRPPTGRQVDCQHHDRARMNSDIHFNKLPHDRADCGWYETLPPPPPPTSLTGRQTADWVVLGGGFAGLAAARRLATLQPESRVVLVDAQPIGMGSAGRNSGFMIDLPHNLTSESYTGRAEEDRQTLLRNRAAIDFMRDIVQTHNIDCDWSEQGKIHGSASDRGTQMLSDFAHGLDAI